MFPVCKLQPTKFVKEVHIDERIWREQALPGGSEVLSVKCDYFFQLRELGCVAMAFSFGRINLW